jgi:general secretion pathway protein G
MYSKKYAFTMIEMVFVIVILGILAAIAIPKFAATRTDAQIAKGRADISAIRSAIMTERQSRLIKGDSSWISNLSNGTKLFDGNDSTHVLLQYGITPGTTDGHWEKTATNAYTYHVGGKDCTFTYNSTTGKFSPGTTADDSSTICKNLVN